MSVSLHKNSLININKAQLNPRSKNNFFICQISKNHAVHQFFINIMCGFNLYSAQINIQMVPFIATDFFLKPFFYFFCFLFHFFFLSFSPILHFFLLSKRKFCYFTNLSSFPCLWCSVFWGYSWISALFWFFQDHLADGMFYLKANQKWFSLSVIVLDLVA